MRNHFMICISGWAGAGKDEVAGHLKRKYSATHTGLADAGKRHGMDTYGFTEEQLWGPSKFRNAGDERYPKPESKGDGHGDSNGPSPLFYLSPREYLQKYLELCNQLYGDTWIDRGIADHLKIATGLYDYSRVKGLEERKGFLEIGDEVTCFSDFRHVHEHRKARSVSGKKGKDFVTKTVLVRIKRPGIETPPFDHRSETEQCLIPDQAYDFIIDNDGTLDDLYGSVDKMMDWTRFSGWTPKTWDQSVILTQNPRKYVP